MENQHWQHIIPMAFVFCVLQYFRTLATLLLLFRQTDSITYYVFQYFFVLSRLFIVFDLIIFFRNRIYKIHRPNFMSRPLPFYDGTSDFSLLFHNILNVYFCNILEFVYDLTISYSHIVRVFRILLPHNPVFLFYCPLVYWDFLGLRMWNKLWAFLQIHNTFICTPQVQCFEPNICPWTLRKS